MKATRFDVRMRRRIAPAGRCESGPAAEALPICGDADLFFDGQRRRLYVVCGEGIVDVRHERDPDHPELARRVPTLRGARTGLFVPRRSTLFVAVPSRHAASAEIRACEVR